MTRHILPLLLLCGLLLAPRLTGQEPDSDEGGAPSTSTSGALSRDQTQIAETYRRLEELMFKMADFEATSNPRRATLLRQAYKQSKDRLTQAQLAHIASLLNQQQYKRALDDQEAARKDLQELLQLLLSEDRSDRLKSEAERTKEQIKELKRIERLQRAVRGRTEGGTDPQSLAKDQGDIADRAGDLAKEMEGAEGQGADAGAAPSGDPAPDATPGDQQPKPSDSEQPPADAGDPKSPPDPSEQSPPGDAGTPPSDPAQTPPAQPGDQPPSEGTPSEGTPSEGEQGQPGSPSPAEATPPADENPAKKRIREAEEKMRQAQQNLEEAKRSESIEKQTEALQKLQEAIAELEKVLRQLREEEMERVLALLEGRFRRMLEAQLKVYDGTVRIDKIEPEQRGRAMDIRANKLAFDQRKIAGDADRCLTLLLEEGSSVAFPHVVEQMRDDMEEVAARLDVTKVDVITQGLQEEIISTLEELIAALQKAQQDLQDSADQPPPGEAGGGGDPPLVDVLAELKMIRSLQIRVNSRTGRYARLLDDVDDPVGQALTEDLREAIGKLAEREASIQRITRDIVLGKNR